MLFKELMPMIRRRPVTITVAALGENKIVVNVIPRFTDADKKINDSIPISEKDKIAAIPDVGIAGLTKPLSLEGTPEEIDERLAVTLTRFTASHVELQDGIDRAMAEIKEAVRAVKDRKPTTERANAKAKATSSTSVTATVQVSSGSEEHPKDPQREASAKDQKPEAQPAASVSQNIGLFE